MCPDNGRTARVMTLPSSPQRSVNELGACSSPSFRYSLDVLLYLSLSRPLPLPAVGGGKLEAPPP